MGAGFVVTFRVTLVLGGFLISFAMCLLFSRSCLIIVFFFLKIMHLSYAG